MVHAADTTQRTALRDLLVGCRARELSSGVPINPSPKMPYFSSGHRHTTGPAFLNFFCSIAARPPPSAPKSAEAPGSLARRLRLQLCRHFILAVHIALSITAASCRVCDTTLVLLAARCRGLRLLLDLCPSDLAWEFLRRNPDYQRDYRLQRRGDQRPRRLKSGQWMTRLRRAPGCRKMGRLSLLLIRNCRRPRPACAGRSAPRRLLSMPSPTARPANWPDLHSEVTSLPRT